MYYDLFNNLSVNVKLAKMLGLQTAVYWAELMHISEKVIAKQAFTEEGYFKLDRNYIESRTTLTVEDQYQCDAVLTKLEVLFANPDDKDQVKLQNAVMVNIITEEDIKSVQKLVKSAKATKAEKSEAKRAGAAAGFKSRLVEPDLEIRDALRNWIDSVYANKGFLTNAVVKTFQETVKQYSSDKAVQLAVINCAMVNGWKDATWAINSYTRNKQVSGTRIMHEQKQVTAVSDVNF